MLRALSCLALCAGRASADPPLFCGSRCALDLVGFGQRTVFLTVGAGGATAELTLAHSTLADVDVRNVSFPHAYTGSDLVSLASPAYTPTFDPHLQILLYTAEGLSVEMRNATGALLSVELPGPVPSGSTLRWTTAAARLESAHVRIVVGKRKSALTALQLVRLPMTAFRAHGSAWSSQTTYWVFFAVSGALLVAYMTLAKPQLWQALAVGGLASFTAVACEKLYHTLSAWLSAQLVVPDVNELVYGVLVVVVLAEGAPAAVCLLFALRKGSSRPVPTSTVCLAAAVGALFLLGSGWFVGPALLGLAAVVRLAQRW